MQRRKIRDVFDQRRFVCQTAQKPLRERGTGFLVSVRVIAPAVEFRCGGLAEIVRQRSEHQPERAIGAVTVLCRRVQYEHRVRPDVALGVKARILRHADEVCNLGKPRAQLIHLAQRLEKHGRVIRLQQRLLQLQHHALRRERGEIHPAAEPHGLLRDAKAEAGSKLRGAQHAQRILGEGLVVHMAQDAAL